MRRLTRHRARSAGSALAVGVALVVTLASCGSSGSGAAAPSAPASVGSVAAAPGAVPTLGAVPTPAVLQFKAPLLAGGALDATTYTGKPVAFWFWAPW